MGGEAAGIYEPSKKKGTTKASRSRLEAYARAVLRNATTELAGLQSGRPTTLFKRVCAIGWAVHHGIISERELTDVFLEACNHNGLIDRDGRRAIEASIHSGLRWAENDPLPELEDRPRSANVIDFNKQKNARSDKAEKLRAGVARLAALDPDEYAVIDKVAEARKLGTDAQTLKKMVKEVCAAAEAANMESADKICRAVEEINADHAFIMSRGGKSCVLHEGFDEEGAAKEFYYSVPDFFNIMANRGALRIVGKATPKSQIWMQSPLRRQYQSVVFDPGTTEREVRGHYNLWRGFGVEPVRGSWSLMRQHIRDVLTASDEEMDAYTVDWLAWTTQNPERQAESALAFRGPRGCGKGVLGRLFARIFGRHGLHLSSSGLLTGRFSAHLEKCAALFADEAFWAGDKPAENQLKRMITEPTLIIEGKGKDAFQAANRLKIMMASNEEWVAPVGARERRFAISDVSHARIGDKVYFANLIREIENGGASAMLYDLLDADVAGFHPRWSIPQTEALKEQARHSLPPEMKWLLLLLEDGRLPYRDLKHLNRTALSSLLEDARKSIDRKKPVQDADLTEMLKKWGVKAKHTKKGNFWEFPPLADMRAQFDREYGKQNWPLSEEEEKLKGELAFTEIPPSKWA